MSLIILIILSEILDYLLSPKKPPYIPKRRYTQLELMSGMKGIPPLWKNPQKNKKSPEDAIYDGCHPPPSEHPPPSRAWVMSWDWLARATLR